MEATKTMVEFFRGAGCGWLVRLLQLLANRQTCPSPPKALLQDLVVELSASVQHLRSAHRLGNAVLVVLLHQAWRVQHPTLHRPRRCLPRDHWKLAPDRYAAQGVTIAGDNWVTADTAGARLGLTDSSGVR